MSDNQVVEVHISKIQPEEKPKSTGWSQGLISDDDFVKGIQYLVENQVIQVD